MGALQLIGIMAFFAFTSGWLYARNQRVFAVGAMAIGIGGSMAQNPFPTERAIAGYDVYGPVGMALFFGGMLILVGWAIVRYAQQSAPHATQS